jgi:hypothetical protein
MESPRNRPSGLMTPTALRCGGSACLIPPQGGFFNGHATGDDHETYEGFGFDFRMPDYQPVADYGISIGISFVVLGALIGRFFTVT